MPELPKRLHNPTLVMLPRVSDQLSFLYLNRVRIERDDNGVHAIFRSDQRGVERVYIPTASIAALLIGPGTSITQPAASQVLKDGGIIVFSGEAGAHFHGSLIHDDLTTRWLHLQVQHWADDEKRAEVARRLYRMRFEDGSLADGKTVDQLRGMEGHRVKNAYRSLSKKHGIPFRRVYDPKDFEAADPVNQALTIANHVLYGVTQAVIAALGASPALGFIHTGGQRSFVYDVADLYKMETAVPAAFAAASEDDPVDAVRRSLRRDWRMLRLTRRIVADIQHALDPNEQHSKGIIDSEFDNVIHLWSPELGALPAGMNYAAEA